VRQPLQSARVLPLDTVSPACSHRRDEAGAQCGLGPLLGLQVRLLPLPRHLSLTRASSVLADVSDGEATAETLAVRFANSDNANLFKVKFEEAQAANAKLALASSTDAPDAKGKDKETPASATTEADSDAPPAFESAPPSATATTGEKKELSAEEEKAQLAAKHEQEDAKGSKDADGEAPVSLRASTTGLC
jgi:hypothetical protein